MSLKVRLSPSLSPGGAGVRGQATVEALAGVALFLLTGAVCLQMLATGHAFSLVDGAAEAAAVAAVNGRSPAKAARRSLPGWAAARAEVARAGGLIRVTVRPPSVIGPLAGLLKVSSTVRVHSGNVS